MLAYYAATAFFIVLDFAAGLNVRLSFLEQHPEARIAYYAVCFFCLALMLWRPGWTELVGAFESLVTLVALILSMGMRAILATGGALGDGVPSVTVPEVINFLLAGGIAYVAWARGIRGLQRLNS